VERHLSRQKQPLPPVKQKGYTSELKETLA